MAMSSKVLTVILVILVFFLVTGCSGSEPQNYSDPSETITVKVNNEFVIALKANMTTGYAWEASFDETILSLVEQNYVPDEHEEGMVGVGGTDYLRFKALQTGSTEIELTYKQPWEENSEDEQHLTFMVEVE